MKKRIAALAIGLSALAVMPALAETMRLGDSAAVTGVKGNIVLRAMPDTEADELAQIAPEESVTYLSPEKDGFAQVEYDGMRGYVPAGKRRMGKQQSAFERQGHCGCRAEIFRTPTADARFAGAGL